MWFFTWCRCSIHSLTTFVERENGGSRSSHVCNTCWHCEASSCSRGTNISARCSSRWNKRKKTRWILSDCHSNSAHGKGITQATTTTPTTKNGTPVHPMEDMDLLTSVPTYVVSHRYCHHTNVEVPFFRQFLYRKWFLKKNDIQYNIHKIKLFLFVIKFTMVDFEKILVFFTSQHWYYKKGSILHFTFYDTPIPTLLKFFWI